MLMLYSKMTLNARFAGYHKLCRSVECNSTHRRKFFLKRNSRRKEGKKRCSQGKEEVKAYLCSSIMDSLSMVGCCSLACCGVVSTGGFGDAIAAIAAIGIRG
jgi:hypothetical protein